MVFQIGVPNVFPCGVAKVFQIGVANVFECGLCKGVHILKSV